MATQKKRKTVRVTFATYISNCGDGSASARFYKDLELAEKAAEKDNERFCEDTDTHTLEIDVATGEIVSGVQTVVEDD